jgi:hypothetical protein
MPGIDDRLERDLERAARPAVPDPGATFRDVTRRRVRRTVARKMQTVALVVFVLGGTAAGFLALQRNVTGANIPQASSTSTPSPSMQAPAFAPIAIPSDPTKVFSVEGLAFPVCHGSMIEGNFLGTGPTYAYVFMKASDAGCLPGEGISVVAVQVPDDPAGRSSTLAAGGPLDCQVDPPVCTAWANPDINGDGQDEIAIATEKQASMTFFELYEATHTADGWALNPFVDAKDLPVTLGEGASADNVAGTYCDVTSGRRRLVAWEATTSDGSSYDVTETFYQVQDGSLVSTGPHHLTSPANELPLSGLAGCGGSIRPWD